MNVASALEVREVVATLHTWEFEKSLIGRKIAVVLQTGVSAGTSTGNSEVLHSILFLRATSVQNNSNMELWS